MTLVTGGSGFIGGHLVDRMLSRGLAVRCLARDPAKLHPGPEVVRGDLSAGGHLRRALDGVSTVIHLAGVTKALHAAAYDAGNRRATECLVEACLASGVSRLVHVSSLAAAGPAPSPAPLDESAPARPVSVYGRSKLASEEAVRRSALCARAVIVRPPVVYGPGDRDVFEVFRLAARGWALNVSRGEGWFSLIHVEDLVDGLLAVAGSTAGGGSIYYLANPAPVRWCDFATAAGRAFGRSVRNVMIPVAVAWAVAVAAECASRVKGKPAILSRDKIREGRQRYWICDSARARRDFGFQPRLSMEDGVAQTAAWYREAGWIQ
jgi:nucleoside-diphosphate-sugar epimerase